MIGEKICRCCGQTLPPPLADLPISEGLKHIVEIVRNAGKHGIATDRLFNQIYGDDIDGGPLTGIKTLHTRICIANRTLRSRGLVIRGQHTGNKGCYGRYVLQRFEQVQDAAE